MNRGTETVQTVLRHSERRFLRQFSCNFYRKVCLLFSPPPSDPEEITQGRSPETIEVVRFSACELSVISEGLLLQVLEDFSFCAFSIQGGKVSEAPIMADEWAEEPRRPARVRRRDPMKGVEEPQLQDQALGSGVRPVDHMNQLSTAELLEHVMRRLTEERGSTQASAIQSFMESLASGAGPSFSIPMQPESAALGEDFDGMD
ncbi:unnamed protein product [Durusdinium trenchii]|uniref:Uncharacterized protein n=1 Tax=Durusdinium trenchii TaxID=1381693 RepID=A0ABP0K4E4_9DINO